MWTSFQLKNFKGYQDSGIQSLRKITVLIGPNGGGKSTLLKFFMMLKQTVESSDIQSALISRGEEGKGGYVDLGLFKEFVYMGEKQRPVSFSLTWDPGNNPRRGERAKTDNGTVMEVNGIKVVLEQRGARNQVVVSNLSYQDAKNQQWFVNLSRGEKAAYHLEIPEDWKGDRLSASNKFYEPQKFCRFSPALLADLPSNTEGRLRTYVAEFEDRIINTYYLGPLRDDPRRIYEATGERPEDIGMKGQRIGSVLYAQPNEDLIDQTTFWLQELDIAEKFSLSRISRDNFFSLNITGKNLKYAANITDYGFGASQILPVLIESLYAPAGATVLIEQPEIHLNAHHQLKLPNFFASLIHNQGPISKQFIIETHSEYFLKRLSTLVARKELLPEELAVLYCYADEDGSHIQPIELDSQGRYSWWPKDFLSEGFEGATEYMEAIQAGEEEADAKE
jgi:AAA15 family ATPase/GTPase